MTRQVRGDSNHLRSFFAAARVRGHTVLPVHTQCCLSICPQCCRRDGTILPEDPLSTQFPVWSVDSCGETAWYSSMSGRDDGQGLSQSKASDGVTFCLTVARTRNGPVGGRGTGQ